MPEGLCGLIDHIPGIAQIGNCHQRESDMCCVSINISNVGRCPQIKESHSKSGCGYSVKTVGWKEHPPTP